MQTISGELQVADISILEGIHILIGAWSWCIATLRIGKDNKRYFWRQEGLKYFTSNDCSKIVFLLEISLNSCLDLKFQLLLEIKVRKTSQKTWREEGELDAGSQCMLKTCIRVLSNKSRRLESHISLRNLFLNGLQNGKKEHSRHCHAFSSALNDLKVN